MRRNGKLLLLFIASCTIVLSCSKKPEKNSQAVSSKMTTISAAPLSIGEIHNIFLREYVQKHGSNQDHHQLSYAEVYSLLKEFAQIGKEQGIFDNSTADIIADNVINDLSTNDYFDSNNMLKDSKTIALKNIAYQNQNNTITTALINITNYNSTSSTFLDYAHSQLLTLNDLNEQEEQEIEAYKSVLESSFSYWNNEEPISSTMGLLDEIAAADAAGARYGFRKAMEGSGWICCITSYVAYYAAVFSKAAAF